MELFNKSMMVYNNVNTDMVKNLASKAERNNIEDRELMDACVEFEALFIRQMLDSMRKTVEKVSFDESSSGSGMDYFEDMLYDNYAKKMAKTADLGIAEMMYRQLYRSETLKYE